MILVKQTASQHLVLVLRKPNAHYSMNMISPFDPNLRQLNLLHTLLLQFCKIHFNIIIINALELFKRPLSFGVLNGKLQAIIISLLSSFSFL